jgi:hypothetical protein
MIEFGDLAQSILGSPQQQAWRSQQARSLQQASKAQIERLYESMLNTPPMPVDWRQYMNFNAKPAPHWVGRVPDDIQ